MATPVLATAGSAYPGAVSAHVRSYSQFGNAVLADYWGDPEDEVTEPEVEVEEVRHEVQPKKRGRPAKKVA